MASANGTRYKVVIQGRAGILYSEGRKTIQIDSEMLMGPTHDIVIWLSKVKTWDPPYDTLAVTDEDKNRIKERILRKLGRRTRVDWE